MTHPHGIGYSLVELADATGLSPRTIHYYSSQGLMPPADRRGAGARYPRTTLDRLRAIQRFKAEARLTLQEIRRVLGQAPHSLVAAIANGEASPWDAVNGPPRAGRSGSASRNEETAGTATFPAPPSASGPGPDTATGSRISRAAPVYSAGPGGTASEGMGKEPTVVGGEASAQLASLLHVLESEAGRSVPRAGSRDHWVSIPITADLQISAHRVSGEEIEKLRKIADYLRALLVAGFQEPRAATRRRPATGPPGPGAGAGS